MQRKPQINPDKSLDDVIMGSKDEQIRAQKQNPEPVPKKEIHEELDPDKLRRQTYYITELYIQAIEQMAFYEKMDKSDIVRNALEQYVPKKYISLAIKP